MRTLAAHNVYPGLGAVVIVVDQPIGFGLNEPDDHVYVALPDGAEGIVIAHL